MLLDISLKDGNGFSLCKKIREQYQVPVIFLTASGDEYSVVTGLELADKASVSKDGREIVLSALEYRLLLIFCQNKGNVVKRGKLLAELWDVGGDFVNDNTLTVYIKRMREKIEDDPAQPERIKTVRGIGYRA